MGSINLTNSTLLNNQAGKGSYNINALYGNPGSPGGAIYNTGTFTINNTMITNNKAGNGGIGGGDYAWRINGGAGGSGGAIYKH